MLQPPRHSHAEVGTAYKCLFVALLCGTLLATGEGRSWTGHKLALTSSADYSFGVVTDVQYADVNDTVSATGTPRFYRWSLDQVQNALGSFNETGLSFAVNIGDLVDMRAAQTSLGAHGSLDRVLSLLRNSTALPWHFALGNHDVANFKYNELQRFLKLNATGTVPPGARAAYSAFSPAPGHRILILDAYDISVHGRNKTDPLTIWAEDFLGRRNKNEDKQNPSLLPPGIGQRFISLNGAFGFEQRMWLERELTDAEGRGDRVLVFSHDLIHPEQVSPQCRLACLSWNFDAVLKILRRHSGTVVAVLSGHDHFGGYARDAESGIHFVTLQGMMDTPMGTSTFGTVDVFRDHLEIHGRGRLVRLPFFARPVSSCRGARKDRFGDLAAARAQQHRATDHRYTVEWLRRTNLLTPVMLLLLITAWQENRTLTFP